MAGFVSVPRPLIPSMSPVAPDLGPGLVKATGATTFRTLRDHLATLPDSLVLATGSTTALPLADWMSQTVNVKAFGAKGDGVTDDTAAMLLARASANGTKPIYLPGGTYLLSKQTLTQDTTLVGDGRFTSTIKLKSGTNDHLLYVSGDHKLTIRDLGIDGNYQQNTTLAPNYPCNVLVPTGSLDIRNSYVHGARGTAAIATGNTDIDFDSTKFAHDVFIIDNLIDQTTGAESGISMGPNNIGDQIRIHRTKRAVVSGNQGKGGLSGIRTDYYCDHLNITGNVITDTYGDVGITAALSTDVLIANNVLTGNYYHGIEIDAVWRGTVSGNVCSGNGYYGILAGPYGPPTNSPGYAGTMDGVAIAYDGAHPGRSVANKDVLIVGNMLAKNGHQGVGALSADGVTVANNVISGNSTTGGSNWGGAYVDGGELNLDNVLLQGNTFWNTGSQTASVQQGNVQFQTRSGGNVHVGGLTHFDFGTRGTRQLNPDPTLFKASTMYVTAGVLVADATSPTGYSRQIADPGAGGNATSEVQILAPAFGSKFVVAHIRTPDTLSKVEVIINLYAGAVWKYTAVDTTLTGIGSTWREFTFHIPASLSSYAYDTLRIDFVTGGADLTVVGNLNIQDVQVFTTAE
jgi:parallel beta-helix repeat protein